MTGSRYVRWQGASIAEGAISRTSEAWSHAGDTYPSAPPGKAFARAPIGRPREKRNPLLALNGGAEGAHVSPGGLPGYRPLRPGPPTPGPLRPLPPVPPRPLPRVARVA